jgi:hypothetical protein
MGYFSQLHAELQEAETYAHHAYLETIDRMPPVRKRSKEQQSEIDADHHEHSKAYYKLVHLGVLD